MICTFGDLADVTWWRWDYYSTRALIGRDVASSADPFADDESRYRDQHEHVARTEPLRGGPSARRAPPLSSNSAHRAT